MKIKKYRPMSPKLKKIMLQMKEMILLCTKGDYFTFCWQTFSQTEWVAMGSALGPVLAGVSMVKPETRLIPTLKIIYYAGKATLTTPSVF